MKKLYISLLLLSLSIILLSKNYNLESKIRKYQPPKSIAIIMDGNRRWSKKFKKSTYHSHVEGIKNVEKILKACKKISIEEISLFAFSSENWNRSKEEVDNLISIFYNYLLVKQNELKEENIEVKFLGNLNAFPENFQNLIESIEKNTINGKYKLNICLNYGGRNEILDAVNKIIENNEIFVDQKKFKEYLYNPKMKDPDLVIRTGGDKRISNFLLWQIAYSEIYVTDKNWPEFTEKDLYKAILDFCKRTRTFGK